MKHHRDIPDTEEIPKWCELDDAEVKDHAKILP